MHFSPQSFLVNVPSPSMRKTLIMKMSFIIKLCDYLTCFYRHITIIVIEFHLNFELENSHHSMFKEIKSNKKLKSRHNFMKLFGINYFCFLWLKLKKCQRLFIHKYLKWSIFTFKWMSLTSDLTRRNKNGDKIFCNSVLVSEIMSSTTIINLKCHFKTLFLFFGSI